MATPSLHAEPTAAVVITASRTPQALADTISDCDENPVSGNGFTFTACSGEALLDALMRALDCYQQPVRWQALLQRCMASDFSWDVSAEAYCEVYRKAHEKKMGIAE